MDRAKIIEEKSAELRLAALNTDNIKARGKLIKIADDLSELLNKLPDTGANTGMPPPLDIGAGTPAETGLAPAATPGQEEEPGKFDINRKPTLPLWNIQILRIYAADGEDAHNIVSKLVETLKEQGHPMVAVGEIRQATDQTTPKGAGR